MCKLELKANHSEVTLRRRKEQETDQDLMNANLRFI